MSARRTVQSSPHADAATAASKRAMLNVACLKSISTDKWEHRWREQHPTISLDIVRIEDWPEARGEALTALQAGALDAALIRLYPGESAHELATNPLHCVTVFDEGQAVLLSKEHPFANEPVIDGSLLDDFDLRAALLPAPMARDARQKDLVSVAVTGLEPTTVSCVWLVSRDDADIQDFVGIIRGRTGRTSRTQAQ